MIGRNYTYQTISASTAFFDDKKFRFNPFIASGSIGMCIDEFNGDNFDHGPHGFVGGGYMGAGADQRPPDRDDAGAARNAKWGAEWKKAVRGELLEQR